jgi:fatty acid amide hydrolase
VLSNARNLVHCSAGELARRIACREVSCRQVVDAHITQIEQVDARLNALVTRRFKQARTEATEADRRLESSARIGPLHGVPVTIKDCFHVAGLPCVIGLGTRQDEPSRGDGPLVERLRAAGAIVLGKTNVPQLMILHETDNPVFGSTRHPASPDRTPGGSSGGEAAIIASCGSPLGLASDLGGSIRIPAHFCGLCGLKPTSGRLTTRGMVTTFRGLTALAVQPGPLARSVADLDLAMSVLTRPVQQVYDLDAAPGPWPDYRRISASRLRVGVWREHPLFAVGPAIRRAVDQAVGALTRAGVIVEAYTPPAFPEAIGCYLALMGADGGADLRQLSRGNRLNGQVRRTLLLARLPRGLRLPIAGALSALGQRHWSFLLRHTGPRTARREWQLADQASRYRDEVLAELRERRLDAVLAPPHALPAIRHGQSTDTLLAACYAFWANLLGFPAGVVPVTSVRATDVDPPRRTRGDRVEHQARRTETDSLGLPVGVQVIAQPWREDIALAVMACVERQSAWEPDCKRADK